MISRLALAALALGAASCGPGVDDRSIAAPPLAYLRGRLDPKVAQAAAGRPLRAALVWGAVPSYPLVCLKFPTHPDLAPACPDPFGFVPGPVEAEIELPADGGTFSIPILRLPPASVAVGTDAARISWGGLLVAADSDGDGAFALLRRDPQGQEPPSLADRVVATSFLTLAAPQQRIGFREGGYAAKSTFYPALGCDSPAAGFSILSPPGLALGADRTLQALPGPCPGGPLGDVEVEALPVSERDARGLACRAVNRAPVRQPAPGGPGGFLGHGGATGKQVCLDANTLAVIGPGDCPTITTYPLKGCRADLVCSAPEWDLTSQPPEGWPCTGP